MRNKKLLLISNRCPPNIVGGAELTAFNLARNSVRNYSRVYFLTLSDDRKFSVSRRERVVKISIPNLNLYNQFQNERRGIIKKVLFNLLDNFNPLYFLLIYILMRRIKPSNIITHNLKGIGLVVWFAIRAAVNAKLFHYVHDYWFICPKATMYSQGKICAKPCLGCSSSSIFKRMASNYFPSSVIFVSDFLRSVHLSNGFFEKPESTVIHNSTGRMVSIFRKPIDLDASIFNIGFIGRQDQTKGVDVLFEALSLLPNKSFILHLAGRPDNKLVPELLKKYPALDVINHGFVDPPVFYKKIDLLVVPSMWAEPFGNVAFECWEYDIPSVVFRNGGLPEVLGDINSLIVDPNPIALSGIISRLINDRDFYLEMKIRCVNRSKYFDVSRQLQQFTSVVK